MAAEDWGSLGSLTSTMEMPSVAERGPITSLTYAPARRSAIYSRWDGRIYWPLARTRAVGLRFSATTAVGVDAITAQEAR